MVLLFISLAAYAMARLIQYRFENHVCFHRSASSTLTG